MPCDRLRRIFPWPGFYPTARYLSPATSAIGIHAGEHDRGLMASLIGHNRHDKAGVIWAADNGCFGRPDAYSDEAFLGWLERCDPTHCLFAVAADVVGDATATWERSLPVLPLIRALGYKPALAAQNGWDGGTVEWDLFDAIFLGGDDLFKLGPEGKRAAADAKAHDKWLHCGRVNSLIRMQYAAGLGCDSCDGTHVAFSPKIRERQVRRWLTRVNQPQLALDFGK